MDIQIDKSDGFLSFVELVVGRPDAKPTTVHAAESFAAAMTAGGFDDVSEDALRFWGASAMTGGMKRSTFRRYLGAVHTLYNDYVGDCAAGDDSMFSSVIEAVGHLADGCPAEAKANLELVKRLTVKREGSEEWQTASIFFYLFFCPVATVSDVARLTFDDASATFCPQVEAIVDKMRGSGRRKYVFDLRQGKARAGQIERELLRDLGELLGAVGMKFPAGFSRESITAMWIAAARRSGIDLRDVRAVVGTVPTEFSALALLRRESIEPGRREAIVCRVADSIDDRTPRWFVMKIRQGVRAEELMDRIKAMNGEAREAVQIFYPMRTVVRKEDGRLLEEEVPVIADLMFFKTQRSRVRELFAEIGDMAWCFRVNRNPESDYSVISNRQMAMFQQCVGQFTPDIRLTLVDRASSSLQRGRRVRIIGGIMAGYEGEIIDIDESSGRRAFLLNLTSSLTARWEIVVDEAVIEGL